MATQEASTNGLAIKVQLNMMFSFLKLNKAFQFRLLASLYTFSIFSAKDHQMQDEKNRHKKRKTVSQLL